MSVFNEWNASLNEAAEISQGNKPPSKVTRYAIADVKAIRSSLNVSQNESADALGTSADTIKSWESKRRNPTGLATIQENPSVYNKLAEH